MASAEYLSKLNEWHLELAIAVHALEKVLWEIEAEGFGAIGHVLRHRFSELVETCPFTAAVGGDASAEPGLPPHGMTGENVVLN